MLGVVHKIFVSNKVAFSIGKFSEPRKFNPRLYSMIMHEHCLKIKCVDLRELAICGNTFGNFDSRCYSGIIPE